MSAPAVVEWLVRRRASTRLHVGRIPFSQCEGWIQDEGALRHVTGRFFSIRGCRCESDLPHLDGLELPMVDQPEVGILGFVVRRDADGFEWLLQAKAEPGTVGGTQVGPTVQATWSNYMRVHGGAPTRMLDLFQDGGPAIRRWLDVEQSEQGDRFIGKYNRNMVVEVDAADLSCDDPMWRWFSARDVRAALLADFAINTDSRSVIFCADWALLADDGKLPFARHAGQGGFGEILLNSLAAASPALLDDAIGRLERARQRGAVRLKCVPLHALGTWRVDDMGIHPLPPLKDPCVQAFAVQTDVREVSAWCQPLMTNVELGRIVLLCAVREGVLRFMLNISFEPGLREGAQFTPSFVSGIGHANPSGVEALLARSDAYVHASARQSDEGGRFMHSVAEYSLVEVPAGAAESFAEGVVWVDLGTLRGMASQRGLLTNELRSAASMLLAWV